MSGLQCVESITYLWVVEWMCIQVLSVGKQCHVGVRRRRAGDTGSISSAGYTWGGAACLRAQHLWSGKQTRVKTLLESVFMPAWETWHHEEMIDDEMGWERMDRDESEWKEWCERGGRGKREERWKGERLGKRERGRRKIRERICNTEQSGEESFREGY